MKRQLPLGILNIRTFQCFEGPRSKSPSVLLESQLPGVLWFLAAAFQRCFNASFNNMPQLSVLILSLFQLGTIALSHPIPQSPATLDFSGYTWTVKSGYTAPGPNNYTEDSVFVDSQGLHLKVKKGFRGAWTCGEVYLDHSLGYGTYSWTVASPVVGFDPVVVFGLFTY